MFAFIAFLRAAAVALITNSHFKDVYPIEALSFGGLIGVALFYIISGYLLVSIKEDTPFGKWYVKKLIRLYVPLFIWNIVLILAGQTAISSVGGVIKAFVFPGTWFGASMVILYVLYYLFVKYFYLKYEKKALYGAAVLLAALYVVLFVTKSPAATFSLSSLTVESPFGLKTMYIIVLPLWLLCMLIGLCIRQYKRPLRANWKKWGSLFLSGVCCVLFFLIRKLMGRDGLADLEILLPIAFIGFGYFLFVCFMSCESLFSRLRETLFGKLAALVSQSSLEIYYVQFLWIDLLQDLAFPLNWLALVIIIVLTGCLLHKLSAWIIQKVFPKLSY